MDTPKKQHPCSIARKFLAEHSIGCEPCLRYWHGEWYRWTGCKYRKVSTDAIKKTIFTFLRKARAAAGKGANCDHSGNDVSKFPHRVRFGGFSRFGIPRFPTFRLSNRNAQWN
jgi:hypothetical protein